MQTLKNRLSLPMKQMLTKSDLIALLRSKKNEIIEALNGKHLVYLNEGSSTVKPNGVRSFTVRDIEDCGIAKNGRAYVTALVVDHDDGDAEKHRTLHLAGMELAWA